MSGGTELRKKNVSQEKALLTISDMRHLLFLCFEKSEQTLPKTNVVRGFIKTVPLAN